MGKIIISSPNVVGKSMAGAAIRPWEFAKALASTHDVILVSPGSPDIQPEGFQLLSYDDPATKKHFADADILITQRLTFPIALLAARHRLKIIIDAYVPGPLELLEHFKDISSQEKQKKIFSETSNLILSFQMADGILCASEKQKELWIGFLLGQKLISPSIYDEDPSLSHFLSVVPFGLPAHPPQKNGIGLREQFGFSPSDTVLLWGGGIWNWFDPLSLIKAMKIVSLSRSDVKLLFMGVVPPDPTLPKTAMARRSIDLAQSLGLLDQSVFFNQEWIPYNERQNFLLEADIGVSTHFEHLETIFSFRTRLLDYLWVNLPIIATEGDSFAQIIKEQGLGKVVPYLNENEIAAAILELVNQPEQRAQIKMRMTTFRETFYWNKATEPLQEMIVRLIATPSKKNRWKIFQNLVKFFFIKIKERGLYSCLKQYLLKKSPT